MTPVLRSGGSYRFRMEFALVPSAAFLTPWWDAYANSGYLDSLRKPPLRTILIGRSKGVAAYNAKRSAGVGTMAQACARPASASTIRKWRPYSGWA